MPEARYKKEFRNIKRRRKASLRAVDLYLDKCTFVFDDEMCARVRESREAMRLTQIEFSSRLGISQSALSKLEAAKVHTISISASQFLVALPECFHFILFGGFIAVRNYENHKETISLRDKSRGVGY